MYNLMEEIRDAVSQVAGQLSIMPYQVTKAQLTKNSHITDYKLRQIGGLMNVKKKYFPVTDKDLSVIEEAREVQRYINKLEKQLGQAKLSEDKLIRAVKDHIKPIKVKQFKPPKRKSKEISRDLVCMLNDVHYGLTVLPEEVSGCNEYNWTIASRRTGYFIDQVCKYKRDKRPYTKNVHLIVNGDIIAGIIHNLTGRDNALLINQINGAIHILVHAVKHLAENFERVNVHFAVGNHGDAPHRREGGHRVSSQVFDNYESIVFYALSLAFKNTASVSFNVNRSIFNSVDLPAGRLIFTHGHLLFSRELGNPGRKIDTQGLSDAIMRFNNGEREKGQKPASMFLVGHTHSTFYFVTPDGTQVFNAPSLSGIDSFAFSIGINHNHVAQLLFESTQQHIFGDSRLINVSDADKNSEYDKLIPPYKNELVWGEDV